MGVKEQLVEKNNQKTKLTKGMNIADMINAMKPEIEKALPKVITPERFTRWLFQQLIQLRNLQSVVRLHFYPD